MTVKEVVLNIENKPGELARIVGHLYENDVNISAFWIGDGAKEAPLRFVTHDAGMAISILTGLALEATTSEAIAAQIPRHPGGVNSLLRVLQSEGIDVLHIYPFLDAQDAVMVLHVDKIDATVNVLKENWIKLYDQNAL
jgi:hypothetical protein